MNSISEVVTAVNKELQHGQLIRQPVIAWALDMSQAPASPEPVAVGSYARFWNNSDRRNIQLVPANPGFFQMYYVLQRSREILERLTAEQRNEIRQTAGAFYLGLRSPEDGTDWREAALMCEREIFEEAEGASSSAHARSTAGSPGSEL